MIEEIKKYLNQMNVNEGYLIKEFSRNIYFGKDNKNNIVFARINTLNDESYNLSTKTITMYQNTIFDFVVDGESTTGNYDVIILNSNYSDTLDTFVNLCLKFYSNTEDKSIIELTEDLIELYKMIGSGSSDEQQGFWAEMLTIIYLYDKFNINIANYWHSDPYNKYDFSLGEKEKIEVKSTIKEYREHTFSHDQLYTSNSVYISSVMMKRDDKGKTIEDLFNEVAPLLNDNYEVLKMLENEMTKYLKGNYLKYDYDYSISNIKFYINDDVPKFEQEEPDGVHGTTYIVQLENVIELNDDDIKLISNIVGKEDNSSEI